MGWERGAGASRRVGLPVRRGAVATAKLPPAAEPLYPQRFFFVTSFLLVCTGTRTLTSTPYDTNLSFATVLLGFPLSWFFPAHFRVALAKALNLTVEVCCAQTQPLTIPAVQPLSQVGVCTTSFPIRASLVANKEGSGAKGLVGFGRLYGVRAGSLGSRPALCDGPGFSSGGP